MISFFYFEVCIAVYLTDPMSPVLAPSGLPLRASSVILYKLHMSSLNVFFTCTYSTRSQVSVTGRHVQESLLTHALQAFTIYLFMHRLYFDMLCKGNTALMYCKDCTVLWQTARQLGYLLTRDL